MKATMHRNKIMPFCTYAQYICTSTRSRNSFPIVAASKCPLYQHNTTHRPFPKRFIHTYTFLCARIHARPRKYLPHHTHAVAQCHIHHASSLHIYKFSMTSGTDPHPKAPCHHVSISALVNGWARHVVVGLNLCPFARETLDSGRLHVAITDADSESGVSHAVYQQVDRLLKTPPERVATTLVVAPRFAPDDFLRFHALCNELEESIENGTLKDSVMLACFHPMHAWADALHHDDPVNFDKRAPFPIINILRTDQVDNVIEQGRTRGILQRNKETLLSVGTQRLKELYSSLVRDSHSDP